MSVWEKSHLKEQEIMTRIWHRKEKPSTRSKKCRTGRARWLTLIILAFWEAKASGSQGQEFETSLANMAKPCLY